MDRAGYRRKFINLCIVRNSIAIQKNDLKELRFLSGRMEENSPDFVLFKAICEHN